MHLASRVVFASLTSGRGGSFPFLSSRRSLTAIFGRRVYSESVDSVNTSSQETSKDATNQTVKNESLQMRPSLTPRQVVESLDRHIVGQQDAKRAIAIAFRNRWRRHLLDESMRNEIHPKNLLMIGPTGVGKTEIARRLAKLSNSPFIKVEATRFTEVGFVGKDVESIIEDLLEISIQDSKKRLRERRAKDIQDNVNEKILHHLLPKRCSTSLREKTKQMLIDGLLEDEKITILFSDKGSGKSDRKRGETGSIESVILKIELGTPSAPTMGRFQEVTVSEARLEFESQEIERLASDKEVIQESIQEVEQNGIVFIDEIDKICTASGHYNGSDPSADGVQRDLLPLVEGSTVTTEHGNVNTAHILFIASGAFHVCKPSDMLPELQGRFPVRVELQALSEEDFYRILTEPETNILQQQIELLQTEGIDVKFDDDAVREMARISAAINSQTQNIGARRLHSVVERVVEEISFNSDDYKGKVFNVTKQYVAERLKSFLESVDLSKFVL